MSKVIIYLLMFLMPSLLLAQNTKLAGRFYKEFEKALNNDFSQDKLNGLFKNYSNLLTPHSDITQLTGTLQGEQLPAFPLNSLKTQKLYIDNIDKLLNSTNPNQRILAYLVVASSNDKTKEATLLNKIKNETAKGNLLWAGMALLHLKSNHTTELFDFLVNNEDFGDAHMLPMFITLDRDSLQQTAYRRINSSDLKAKVLAAQILSVTGLNSTTEKVLKDAVKTWDINIKGYAIYSIKELQIGNVLEVLKPLLDNKKARSISLEALANSPTAADRNYLLDLIPKNDTIPEELLDCLYKSKNIENVKYWLTLIRDKPIPKDYIFFIHDKLITSDSVLPELQAVLPAIKNKGVLSELVRALQHRTDDKSINLLISFLHHQSPSVRYWTAKTLEGNPSPELKLPTVEKAIQDGLNDGNTPDD